MDVHLDSDVSKVVTFAKPSCESRVGENLDYCNYHQSLSSSNSVSKGNSCLCVFVGGWGDFQRNTMVSNQS